MVPATDGSKAVQRSAVDAEGAKRNHRCLLQCSAARLMIGQWHYSMSQMSSWSVIVLHVLHVDIP